MSGGEDVVLVDEGAAAELAVAVEEPGHEGELVLDGLLAVDDAGAGEALAAVLVEGGVEGELLRGRLVLDGLELAEEVADDVLLLAADAEFLKGKIM